MRPILAAALICGSAFAQQPGGFDESFFNGDRRTVLKALSERLLLLKGGDALFLVEAGRGYLAGMDRPKGEAALKAAEAREPKDGRVLRLIAQAWLKSGYKQEAMDAYALVLQRDPGNKEALAQSAVDLAEVGFVAEADRFMKAYALLEKDDWKAFIRFGRAYLACGQRRLASPWFARALFLKPKEEKAYWEILEAFTETQAVL